MDEGGLLYKQGNIQPGNGTRVKRKKFKNCRLEQIEITDKHLTTNTYI